MKYKGIIFGMKIQMVSFQPTRHEDRGWIIPFVTEKTPWYMCIAACVPGMTLALKFKTEIHIFDF